MGLLCKLSIVVFYMDILLFCIVFNVARGHEMERKNYLEDLQQRKPKKYVRLRLVSE